MMTRLAFADIDCVDTVAVAEVDNADIVCWC